MTNNGKDQEPLLKNQQKLHTVDCTLQIKVYNLVTGTQIFMLEWKIYEYYNNIFYN